MLGKMVMALHNKRTNRVFKINRAINRIVNYNKYAADFSLCNNI